MTDEEKFQKTFDKLHASPDVLTEVLKMTAKEQVVPMKKKRFTPKAAAAIAAVQPEGPPPTTITSQPFDIGTERFLKDIFSLSSELIGNAAETDAIPDTATPIKPNCFTKLRRDILFFPILFSILNYSTFQLSVRNEGTGIPSVL